MFIHIYYYNALFEKIKVYKNRYNIILYYTYKSIFKETIHILLQFILKKKYVFIDLKYLYQCLHKKLNYLLFLIC